VTHRHRPRFFGLVVLAFMVLACTRTASPSAPPQGGPGPIAAPAKPTDPPPGQAASQPEGFDERAVADFYRGKTMRIIVGFAPGGVFDVLARLVARYAPQYIPGNPAIIVENKPGAGSLLAANSVYNAEPRDGTVIGTFVEGLVLQQALKADGVQFDGTKFNWLISFQKVQFSCVVRTDAGINSIQEVMDGKQMIVGSLGPGTGPHDVAAVLNATLNTRFKIVPGYDGVTNVLLAMERGEMEGVCVSTTSADTAPYWERQPPPIKTLIVMGDKQSEVPTAKGAPAAETLARTEEAKQLLRALAARDSMGRPMAFGPGVPSDRVQAVRKALDQTARDPRFQADAGRSFLDLDPSTGPEVEQIVQELLNTSPDTLARLKEILK
jgi:tripartite-type tricarboxylate transporter receptor subunit TctC